MKLSIIIPVYQVEHTLRRCVDSILSQGMEAVEIILVDDGSTDGSGYICDAYAREHPQVKVIHKENGGLSDARNAGIEAATGDYLTFVDSDDWIEGCPYPRLMAALTRRPTDILEFSAVAHSGSPQQWSLQLEDKEYLSPQEYWTGGKAYQHTYAWNKLFRASLFGQVRFPKGKVFEDAWTLPLLIRQARSIATTQTGTYHYWHNPQGITAQADGNALLSLLEAQMEAVELLGIDLSRQPEYYLCLLNIQIDVYRHTGAIILPDMASHLSIRRQEGISQRIKIIILKLSGIKNLCKLHKTLHSLW